MFRATTQVIRAVPKAASRRTISTSTRRMAHHEVPSQEGVHKWDRIQHQGNYGHRFSFDMSRGQCLFAGFIIGGVTTIASVALLSIGQLQAGYISLPSKE